MSFAVGQALEGNIPFYVNSAMYVTGTAWTQLRQACYAKANVKLVGSHPGMDDGPDGASHHALEDLAVTRALPRLTILTPADADEIAEAFEQAVQINGPVYIHVAREPMPIRDKSLISRVTDIASVAENGNDFAILYKGTVLEQAMEGYQQLVTSGKKGKLIHVATLKPFNRQRFCQLIAGCPTLLSIENHSITGRLGGQLAEVIAEEGLNCRLIRLGTQDTFTESGNSRQLKEKYGISANAIYERLAN